MVSVFMLKMMRIHDECQPVSSAGSALFGQREMY